MGRNKLKKNEEEIYIIQTFVKNVQYEVISSRILLHLGLTHLIVGDGNEVVEFFKFHIFKCLNMEYLGRKVVLNMVVFRKS